MRKINIQLIWNEDNFRIRDCIPVIGTKWGEMNLKDIIAFSHKVEYIFIATSGNDCVPVMDTAKTIKLNDENQIVIKEWLCDYTIMNLNENKKCTLLVWDEKEDAGYQLTGKVIEMQSLAFLEGHEFGAEDTRNLPKVLWSLVIDIDKIKNFSHAPKEQVRVVVKDNQNIRDRMD